MSDLPEWNGAAIVYARLMTAARSIQAAAYYSQSRAAKGRKFRFSPDIDGLSISDAMGKGDEEQCKALAHTHRRLWL